MPSSRPDHIPIVLAVVRQLQPKSILEIGVGFGKWGHLFREYTDIVMAETEPTRYQRENWQVRIDGIEGYQPYITPAHRYLYNALFIGDMREKIHEVDTYDIIFLGDVIEHVEKADGLQLLRACLDHARVAVVVTTPASAAPQAAACGNDLEVHRSAWSVADFRSLGRCTTKLDDNQTLIAVLLKAGVEPPSWQPRRRRTPPHRAGLWQRLRQRLGATALGGPIRAAQDRGTSGVSTRIAQIRLMVNM